jgi:hypothetical protein
MAPPHAAVGHSSAHTGDYVCILHNETKNTCQNFTRSDSSLGTSTDRKFCTEIAGNMKLHFWDQGHREHWEQVWWSARVQMLNLSNAHFEVQPVI